MRRFIKLVSHKFYVIKKQFQGIVIGALFTLASLLLTITLIVPIITMIPATYIEYLSSILVNDDSNNKVGHMTIGILSILFIINIVIALVYVRKQSKKNMLSKMDIIYIMIISWFIVHPLAFYIYWGVKLGFRGDGQLIFGVFYTFPFSSFWFVIMGVLIDIVRRFNQMRKNKRIIHK